MKAGSICFEEDVGEAELIWKVSTSLSLSLSLSLSPYLLSSFYFFSLCLYTKSNLDYRDLRCQSLIWTTNANLMLVYHLWKAWTNMEKVPKTACKINLSFY